MPKNKKNLKGIRHDFDRIKLHKKGFRNIIFKFIFYCVSTEQYSTKKVSITNVVIQN